MAEAIEVRLYREDDYHACRGLWAELTEHHRQIYGDSTVGGEDAGAGFDGYLADRARIEMWVAQRGAEVIGLVGLLSHGDELEVEPVVVTASQRRRGVGRALLAKAIAEARRRGAPTLSIRPVARNREALRRFRDAGFRTMGHVELFMDLSGRGREWEAGGSISGLDFDI